ncbi:hypothetical protein ASF72_18340 [Arthrobacter sp. Leaf141]|uniref:DUF7341 domain-containing protein n=1 Tax=Arthrobacter sp. Leaf141 TaxID=1736273 RepID=UPI0006F501FC|nr:hypothetical protein [Arthrobacter sp. Leaf141]KQQ98405.1 hypothetical protein ASF72_18340 [Arthrobacter sp. Leaf141]
MNTDTLNATVHRLTREHRTTNTDADTGEKSYPTELSLFQQLQQEIQSGRRAEGAGGGTGSRSPIAIPAFSLWSEIRETLATMHTAITGKDEPKLSAESKLQKWAAWTQADNSGETARKCLENATKWMLSIQQMLNPVRRAEIVGACPQDECGATHAWTWDEGEYVRNTAITATGAEATCGACGTVWAGTELYTLAKEIGKVAA